MILVRVDFVFQEHIRFQLQKKTTLVRSSCKLALHPQSFVKVIPFIMHFLQNA